ncbi:CYTH domain-containing protein [Methylobacterium sp. RAS18]|nr:CYTH domain-containing protein [Methylobacterium sp. RAS18]
MSVVRRFLVAPSLVRLLRKERGGSRVTEGYFAPQAGRTSFVRLQGTNCFLVLMTGSEGAMAEERTEVPRAHGDALLDVCQGRAVYERTTVSLGGSVEALVDRYVRPSGLDIVSLVFSDASAAQGFTPPVWFGAEVTTDKAYDGQSIAITGVPTPGDIPLSNAALDAVLDLIEPRFGSNRAPFTPSKPVSPPRDTPARPPEPPKPAPVPDALLAAAVAEPATPPETKSEEQPQASEEPLPAAAEPTPEAPKAEEPAPAEAAAPEPAAVEEPAPTEAAKPEEAQPAAETADAQKPAAESGERLPPDARIDDVIESLSKALGAAIRNPQEPGRDEEVTEAFERWQVRPRRTQQT